MAYKLKYSINSDKGISPRYAVEPIKQEPLLFETEKDALTWFAANKSLILQNVFNKMFYGDFVVMEDSVKTEEVQCNANVIFVDNTVTIKYLQS